LKGKAGSLSKCYSCTFGSKIECHICRLGCCSAWTSIYNFIAERSDEPVETTMVCFKQQYLHVLPQQAR